VEVEGCSGGSQVSAQFFSHGQGDRKARGLDR
jgi:hypothetical protein